MTIGAGRALLVTGGAGYIGSHVVLALIDAGWPVVVLDDLSTGRRESLPPDVRLVEGDVGDRDLVAGLIGTHRIWGVVHLAGALIVPESVRRPLAYYRNNTLNSHTLIDVCVQAGIGAFVFSSTAAVYGEPAANPVDEDAVPCPVNPYGRSKLMTEQMLADAGRAHGLPYIVLRYFNVAGADPGGRIGAVPTSDTHLLKVACEVALGRRRSMQLFGDDYPTPDGTCVRDLIHVSDLADAHVKAIGHLRAGRPSRILNCGYGTGYSVREVIDTVARVGGQPVPVATSARRAGDAAAVVAASDRIRAELGWRPRHANLDRIVGDTLAAESRRIPVK